MDGSVAKLNKIKERDSFKDVSSKPLPNPRGVMKKFVFNSVTCVQSRRDNGRNETFVMQASQSVIRDRLIDPAPISLSTNSSICQLFEPSTLREQ